MAWYGTVLCVACATFPQLRHTLSQKCVRCPAETKKCVPTGRRAWVRFMTNALATGGTNFAQSNLSEILSVGGSRDSQDCTCMIDNDWDHLLTPKFLQVQFVLFGSETLWDPAVGQTFWKISVHWKWDRPMKSQCNTNGAVKMI